MSGGNTDLVNFTEWNKRQIEVNAGKLKTRESVSNQIIKQMKEQ